MKTRTLCCLTVFALAIVLGFNTYAELPNSESVPGVVAEAVTEAPGVNAQPDAVNTPAPFLGNQQPVFLGSTAECDQACQNQLESCLRNCGTSGPACGCLSQYISCTLACCGP
ncbi:MAG: hypothetical protein K0U98_04580 [Deltaproteobacteria bacterium]|nr:hypothetical protein [Deltaproteobacteria bacterium]